MKLTTAYVCFNSSFGDDGETKYCLEVFDGRDGKGRCPACFSENIQALGWSLAQQERKNWLTRIGMPLDGKRHAAPTHHQHYSLE